MSYDNDDPRPDLPTALRAPIVDIAEVGDPQALSSMETICAVFHGFHNQIMEWSPPLHCHGYAWKIFVHTTGEYLSVHLMLPDADSDVNAMFTLRIGSTTWKLPSIHTFRAAGGPHQVRGIRHFAPLRRVDREHGLLDEHGSLKVYATIQVAGSVAATNSTWIPPPENLAKDMLQLLKSEENVDVVFALGGGDPTQVCTRVRAHQMILGARSNFFKNLFQDALSTRSNDNNNNNDKMDEIPLEDVNPSHFELLLRFLYTERVPDKFHDQTIEYYQDILQLANKFECVPLKLLAEAKIIDSSNGGGITVENAADLLVFADAHCCALLREKATRVFATNPKAVMASNGWSNIAASTDLLNELLHVAFASATTTTTPTTKQTLAGSKRQRSSSSEDCSYAKLRVTDLRKQLYKRGLELDGTREMLITRLREADNGNDGL